MERLLQSSYPIPFRIQAKPSPFLHRLGRVHSPEPNFPSPTRSQFIKVESVSFKHENPSTFSFPSPSPAVKLQSFSPARVDSAKGSVPQSHSHSPAVGGDSWKKGAPLGTVILLSALTMIVINPILAPPALATLQTATANTATLMRVGLLSSAWTGFFAGCLHTLSGPDHLAALAPLSIGRSPMESAAVGALWGCGHDAGQVLFGLIFLLLKDRLHIEIIQTWGAIVVGFTLVLIGAMGIKEALEAPPPPLVAIGNGECDVGALEALEGPKRVKKKIGFATFATGVVHGLQPDAMMMVLPALALPSRIAGAAYLGMFLFGTVVAMGIYTVFIGSCSEALKDRVPRITEKLTWASSLIAIGLGLAIVFSQYIGYSLY